MANTNYNMYQAALALFNSAPQATVTPAQLVATMSPVGMAMAPASKHAWKLGTLGFDITANKDGRNVVSYTMVSAPAQAPAQKAVAVKKAKAPKAPKASAKAPATVAKAAAAKGNKKSPTAKKAATVTAAPAMTQAELEAAASAVDIGDVNELDDRSDLPEFLR